MSAFVVPIGHGGNDYVLFLQDVMYPSNKSWLVMSALGCGILIHFNRITFLQVSQPFS
jgi:hypothetical protein